MSKKQSASSHFGIVFSMHGYGGWGPISHMANLASDLLEVPLEKPALREFSLWRRTRLTVLPLAKDGEAWKLYIARSPVSLKRYLALPEFDRPHRRVAWIIDSFRSDIMLSPRLFRYFDLVVYTQKGEREAYERVAPGRTIYLPWGADVLEFGTGTGDRDIDLLRVGRQPEAWDDDARSATLCKMTGLRFQGRPPIDPDADPSLEQKRLMGWYGRSRFLLAFSNLVAQSEYTHPTKDYITGRWTDALAAGATVAGIAPMRDASCEDLLWPGATLEFDRIDPARNVETLRAAVAEWTPEVARQNYCEALQRLDWRWRFKTLADRMELRAPKLAADLERLKAAIAATA